MITLLELSKLHQVVKFVEVGFVTAVFDTNWTVVNADSKIILTDAEFTSRYRKVHGRLYRHNGRTLGFKYTGQWIQVNGVEIKSGDYVLSDDDFATFFINSNYTPIHPLPCPFCGSTELVEGDTMFCEYGGHERYNGAVECKCGASVYVDSFECSCCNDVQGHALLKWNTRYENTSI